MSIIQSHKLNNDSTIEENVTKGEQKVQILLLNDGHYLLGLLKGFCYVTGCLVKAINDYDSFFKAIKKITPSLVFINMSLAPQLFSLAEWRTTLQFMKENNITLCGFGKQPLDNEDSLSCSVFDKIFTEPFCEDEILIFLQERLAVNVLENNERRFRERRKGTDRRNFTQTQKMQGAPAVNSKNLSFDQQNTEDNISIGPLVIDRSHKVITVNDIPIHLSPKEFEIIDLLATNPGCVIKTEDIITKVWPEFNRATKADVHQFIHMLRKKIEVNAKKPNLLVTVKGFGYKLCP